jgi:uncharacterized oligopeptide transporter (OPT) family protein
MAPDRGRHPDGSPNPSSAAPAALADHEPSHSSTAELLAQRASEPQNFTLRGVLVGLVIGIIICFSNTYFGLQTGWVSGMAMPSALLGFAYFKTVARWISFPFSPVENVLVQSVAGAVGTMPLGCGFVAVIPALEYLLLPEENGPLHLSLGKLIVWAVGICFFGVVFAVPLRRQVIIREKLKFPSGTATALMIGVLHGEKGDTGTIRQNAKGGEEEDEEDEPTGPVSPGCVARHDQYDEVSSSLLEQQQQSEEEGNGDWKKKIKLLLWSFAFSGFYVSNALAASIQLRG